MAVNSNLENNPKATLENLLVKKKKEQNSQNNLESAADPQL